VALLRAWQLPQGAAQQGVAPRGLPPHDPHSSREGRGQGFDVAQLELCEPAVGDVLLQLMVKFGWEIKRALVIDDFETNHTAGNARAGDWRMYNQPLWILTCSMTSAAASASVRLLLKCFSAMTKAHVEHAGNDARTLPFSPPLPDTVQEETK
jgi:hypothetical protein